MLCSPILDTDSFEIYLFTARLDQSPATVMLHPEHFPAIMHPHVMQLSPFSWRNHPIAECPVPFRFVLEFIKSQMISFVAGQLAIVKTLFNTFTTETVALCLS